MRKIRSMIFLALLFLAVSGCGAKEEDVVREPQWEKIEEGNTPGAGESEEETGTADGEEKTAGEEGDSESGGKNYGDLEEGLIEDQSFEVELDGWGKVFFAAAAPSEGSWTPRFMLIRDNEVIYTFPETPGSAGSQFTEVSAVAFQDYNRDGKKDVIVLTGYTDGQNRWNVPEIFLQENSDNMFYLDHPKLEEYRVEGPAQTGHGFYRDTFLEEFLSKEGVTDSVASLADSWVEYVDYADSLTGSFGEMQQIKLFAENREIWTEGMDYANDVHRFTIANLGYDGKLTLIAANQGGTGCYTYSEFYQIDEKGGLKKLESSFKEGDSQPDIMEDSMTVYCSFSLSGNRNHFIVHDMLKDSPATYVYRVSSISIRDEFVLETPLASQMVVYEGEGDVARITSEDCNGNGLTEEEYENFADDYYSRMGLTKKTAGFQWADVSSLEGVSDEEAEEMLKRVYKSFSLE